MLDVTLTGRSGASMSLIQVFATIKPRNFIHKIYKNCNFVKKNLRFRQLFIFSSPVPPIVVQNVTLHDSEIWLPV
jgi:hypothetical protein